MSKAAYYELGKIFNALSNSQKIKGLELIRQRKSLQEIPKEIGISRTGFQGWLEDYKDSGLTYRDKPRTYTVSLLGEKVLDEVLPVGLRITEEHMPEGLDKKVSELVKTYGKDTVIKKLEKIG